MDEEVEVLSAIVTSMWGRNCTHRGVDEVRDAKGTHHVHLFAVEGLAGATEIYAWCSPQRGRRQCYAALRVPPIQNAADAVKLVGDPELPKAIRDLIRCMAVHDTRAPSAECDC